jgi:hypothetical protein
MHIARQRLVNQRLVGEPFGGPEAAVRWLGAVQAQDYNGAKWALALRTRGVDSGTIDHAFNAGAFLRTHVMRPTWHFVAPEDLRWLLALTGARVHAANAHMYRRLELTGKVCRRANALISAALEGRHATRPELATILEANGIPARGQRLAYVMMQAELEGLVCSGPMCGKQHTYALLEERVPAAAPLARDAALALLATRYFQSHGPAMVRDFAWWSGLTISDAKAAVEMVRSDLECANVDGKAYWTGGAAGAVETKEPVIHLLPNYDEHVVAYRNHSPSLDAAAVDALRTRTDRPLDAHLVARNGLIVGGWKRTLDRKAAVAQVISLVKLKPRERAALKVAVQAYGVFVRLPITVEIT